ncbi:hypothetical protein INS49_004719 [Diaporthe citri]|uniref:uncharacterized protein n=1 Tax=Diaporthe citri TaxID=83186 RepID=UPI001C7F1BC6|nr:uncharacterized protein INS49_004719 [Diaporthe citri]KAG6354701.1 hypothetical protein INS49_004719 [Diaporthe citri]
MRPSHILAALGATTTTFAQAQDTKPNPDQVAQATDCSSSTTTTWALPSTSAPSTIPANFTVTLIDAPANSTTTDGSFTLTITSAGTGPVTATSSSSPAAASSSSSSVAAAAAAGEGLSSDSSMLGLVIFFALSLCLL